MTDQTPVPLSFDALKEACSPGGSSVLTSVTPLEPAVGPHGTVTPAKYLSGKGGSAKAVYAYQRTVVDGEARLAVILASKQDQANRRETAQVAAIRDDQHPAHGVMSRVPHVAVRYTGEDGQLIELTDFELPHRGFDGHVRAGTHGGTPVVETDEFRAARNSTPADMRGLFNLSPNSVHNGSWDSSRRSNQVRLPSAMVSEIIGVLADQGEDAMEPLPRGAARVDPVAASVVLDKADRKRIAETQKSELSEKTYDKIVKSNKASESASDLGLGNIAPSLESIGGVACREILRSTALSFASLRQLRFGGSGEQDVAFRAVLAALSLLGMALADEELYLRANCHLRESGEPTVTLDGRYGRSTALEPITVELAIDLMQQALDHAAQFADFSWDGQAFVVDGDPVILAKSVDDSDADE